MAKNPTGIEAARKYCQSRIKLHMTQLKRAEEQAQANPNKRMRYYYIAVAGGLTQIIRELSTLLYKLG